MKESNFARIYKNQSFLHPYDHPVNEFPFYVDIELTNKCNLKCIMCSRQIMSRQQGFMDTTTYEKIIDEMSQYKAGVRFVRHGEPLLHKELIQMSRYAKDKKVMIFISTNGLLLNEDLCIKMVETKIDEIRFSMQGLERGEYNRMRVGGNYDLFINNIKMLKRIRGEMGSNIPFLSLSTSITNEGKKQIEVFKKFWLDIIDSLNIDVTNFARVEHLEEVKPFLLSENLERKYQPCAEVVTKLSVNWNGDIVACCKDYDGQLILGNIEQLSLKDAWESTKLNKLREIVGTALNHKIIPMCRKCYNVTSKFNDLKEQYKGEV